jgi:glycosyltransferase involved in cell wall biosynthesis
MSSVHQFVAGFSNGDAISNEARVLQRMFRGWGLASELYCEQKRILPELRPLARDIGKAAAEIQPDDVAVLHLSIGSVVNQVFADLKCRKAIMYHNITPPDFFRGYQEEIVHSLRKGLDQARQLAGSADVVMAVSQYNAGELERMGYRDVKVVPLFLDREGWKIPPSGRVTKLYKDGKKNILFVGRCAPNKRIEDLLFAFYYFQRYVEPESRLIHVGSYAGLERYYALLRTKSVELKLENVFFAGSVRQDELNAYYRCADAFLCMSEHEGFCIPVLEAMHHRVPVLAYAAGAVPETMDGAGILFREKQFDHVSEMLGRLVADTVLREKILTQQDRRLAAYTGRDLEGELKACLRPLLG